MAGSRIYFGWWVALGGALGLIMTSPGQTYSVSIFINPLIQDLDIGRAWISALYGIATLSGSLMLPWVGRLIDRFGPRRMVLVIAGAFAGACLVMGAAVNAWTLAVGFLMVRMLGQGSLAIVSQNVINRWWIRRRGRANAIAGVLSGMLGVGAFPSLINALIPAVGWRWTYVCLGALVLAVMVPVGWLLYHNRPEDFGLLPDGRPRRGQTQAQPLEEVWTLKQAARTGAFWVLAAIGSSVAMLSTGLFFHMVSIFADRALSSEVAAAAFLPIAVATSAAQFCGGLLLDHIPVRYLAAVALAGQAVALWLAPHLDGVDVALLYGAILGASGGLMGVVVSVAWAQFFGRAHLGSIAGTAQTLSVAGSALGPLPFGLARDITGGYGPTALLALIPMFLALLALWKAVPPSHPNSLNKP